MASTTDLVFDKVTGTWHLPTAPVSPALAQRGQRERIASAARNAPPAAQQHARALVGHLANIADTAQTHGVIRGTAASGGHGRANAQQMLDTQRQLVLSANNAATEALKALKPALLSAVVALPDGVTPEQVKERRDDLIAALQAAGPSGANYRAQQLLQQAMDQNDALMAYVICSPDVMGYRAATLGYSLQTLQQKYAAAQVAKVGLRPLMGAGAVPGAELIDLLPELQEAITGHTAAATQALNTLAAEVGLQ